jgi:hypothetical protein
LTSLDFDLCDTAGGESVTITGTDLADATAVTVGGTSATITANTETSLTFTTPAKTAGTYDVVVTTENGSSDPVSLEAWTPESISSAVKRWWDAARGRTVSGSNLTVWTSQDASAEAWTSTAQGSFEPVYSATGFGTGKPGIVYTKGADFIEKAAAGTVVYGHGISIFVVAKTTDNTTSPGHAFDMPNCLVSDHTNTWNLGFGLIQDKIEFSRYDNSTVEHFRTDDVDANDGNPHVFGVTHAEVGGAIIVYKDNVAYATNVGGTPASTKTWIGTQISSIGCGFGWNDRFGGTIGAVIVVEGVLSSSDRLKLYKWSKIRFGVA